MPKDKIYSQPKDPLVKFTFDERVADVFDDMVRRSIPGYATTIAMIGVLAKRYAQAGSNCYDLGCSLGASSLAMRHHISHTDVRIIAVDNSGPMTERCKKIMQRDNSPIHVDVQCADISDVPIEKASVVIMNFTLQFLNPADRLSMLQKIYDGLLPGGILVLSEKIKFDGSAEHELQNEWYWDFKKANGYSELEIAQKRTALENVLLPDTVEEHFERLKQTGFANAWQWFRCFNFTSFIAIK